MTRLRRAKPYDRTGYRRERRGETFRYVTDAGAALDPTERARVVALAIPPAWEHVWMASAPNAHILAVGVDQAGRRQYIYHPDWRARKDNEKFLRARELAATLPAARRSVTRDLRRPELDRTRVRAAAFRILDSAAIRVGGEEYALVHGSHGLTTLLRRHARVDGSAIQLRFPAKSGQRANVSLDDTDLAEVLRLLHAGSGASRLFAWRENGVVRRLSGTDINEYIVERTGGTFTAKDFRTLKGTVSAALSLARTPVPTTVRERKAAVRTAIEAAAADLGNTPTIAKNSYIDPVVFDRFDAGETISLDRAPELALLDLLN